MSNTKKNAVFMMCIINEHYIIGVCIASYCHRKIMELKGIKDTTDLVIMCDGKIYDKYHELLTQPMFFDRVIRLDMRFFPDSPKYSYSKIKYSSWIGASLNKWQILNFDEYGKIIFTDVSVIPTNPDFYNLFDQKTPAVYIRKKVLNRPEDLQCTDGRLIDYDAEDSRDPQKSPPPYDRYLENEEQYGTIHGWLAVITPNKSLYKEYVAMTDDIYKDGIYSIYKSGPDETSLFYFFLAKRINMYSICHFNAIVPWDEASLIDIANGYIFSAMYKPWIKPKVLSWPEEILWRDIYELALKNLMKHETNHNSSTSLRDLFKQTMISTYKKYVESDNRSKHKNFNDKFIKNVQKQFDNLSNMTDDDLYAGLMNLDSKIYVKYYGKLKLDTLLSQL
jgi:hypothetical protein